MDYMTTQRIINAMITRRIVSIASEGAFHMKHFSNRGKSQSIACLLIGSHNYRVE
jgi:hypothetical protein